MIDLALKLLDQHPGAVLGCFLLALSYVYTQARTMLDVRYMRRHMVSRKDLQLHKAQVNETLARDYVRKEHCAAMHAALSQGGRSNGTALGI